MKVARVGGAVAFVVTFVAVLGACSSAGSAKPAGVVSQTSMSGCDMPPSTPSDRILDLSIAQGFYDDRLFADPAPTYNIVSQGKITNSIDFNQWWDKYEGDRSLVLDGKTMADWELELLQSTFPNGAGVYTSYCSGWRFSEYVKRHSSGASTKGSASSAPTT